MSRLLAIVLFANAAAGAVNLLENPGFERRLGDMPVGWHVYVEPQQGSAGELHGGEALEGRWSVLLKNAFAYPNEPANNWSQNVLEDLAAKTLVLTGSIKTEDATEAALWLQCFRKDPWEVVLQKSTADSVSMSGTHPWTPVAVEVAVPAETDFVVVRCVLKGTGAAWFDEISLERKNVPATAAPAVEKPVSAPLSPDPPRIPAIPNVPRMTPPSDDATRNEIIAAHETIREANEALRQSNQALAEQLQVMRDELEAMREQIREVGRASQEAARDTKAGPKTPVPPLVPRVPKEPDEEAP